VAGHPVCLGFKHDEMIGVDNKDFRHQLTNAGGNRFPR